MATHGDAGYSAEGRWRWEGPVDGEFRAGRSWKIWTNHGTIMEHMENLYKNHGTYRKNMVKSWKTYGQQTIENIFFSANSWKIMENMENDGKNV